MRSILVIADADLTHGDITVPTLALIKKETFYAESLQCCRISHLL